MKEGRATQSRITTLERAYALERAFPWNAGSNSVYFDASEDFDNSGELLSILTQLSTLALNKLAMDGSLLGGRREQPTL